MRLLWVKGGKLFPVDTGGKIRTYNILKNLARTNDVTFLSYYPGARDVEYERELEREFPGAVGVAIPEPGGRIGQLVHYGLRLLHHAPYSVTKYTDAAVKAAILRLFRERTFDVAVCDFLLVSLNFPRETAVPTVLFQHNVESSLWKRQAALERNPVKRAFFTLEAAKMYRYEQKAITRFDGVIAVSDYDRDLMRTMDASARIDVVPTGVDVRHFIPGSVPRSATNVVFLGSMDWPPNIDGVEYFCESVWPRVIAAEPGARFRVVGRRPPERIKRLASESVEIVGGVDDVRPALHDAAVFVVPLRIGGGTRLKIYEAMAAGVPIVSTTIGAEGLDVTSDRDIIIRDDNPGMADAIIGLLRNEDRRREVADEAFRTVARFDWPAVAETFQQKLAGAITTARGSRARR